MPDHEELEMILDGMLHILESYNYKKVTPCSRCWFWGTREEREKGLKHIRECRHCHMDKYHDEWCSDAVIIKKGLDDIFTASIIEMAERKEE